MTTILTDDNPVLEKTRELCASILDQPDLRGYLDKVEAFIADEDARAQFVQFSEMSNDLQARQRDGAQLEEAEVEEIESLQSEVLENDVIRDFLEAQEELQNLHNTISTYVAKTLELGRVPEKDDFQDQGHSCGNHDCGCHY